MLKIVGNILGAVIVIAAVSLLVVIAIKLSVWLVML